MVYTITVVIVFLYSTVEVWYIMRLCVWGVVLVLAVIAAYVWALSIIRTEIRVLGAVINK